MIRTKAYLTREISSLIKRKNKLLEELEILKAYDKMRPGLKKSIGLAEQEIHDIKVKVEAFNWVANTSEKQLPKIKNKKKKKKKDKKVEANKEINKK